MSNIIKLYIVKNTDTGLYLRGFPGNWKNDLRAWGSKPRVWTNRSYLAKSLNHYFFGTGMSDWKKKSKDFDTLLDLIPANWVVLELSDMWTREIHSKAWNASVTQSDDPECCDSCRYQNKIHQMSHLELEDETSRFGSIGLLISENQERYALDALSCLNEVTFRFRWIVLQHNTWPPSKGS